MGQSDTPPCSFNMAEETRKRLSAEEAIEAIFADEDSNDEDFNYGSDIDFVPDSADEENSNIEAISDRISSLSTSNPLSLEDSQLSGRTMNKNALKCIKNIKYKLWHM